MPRSTRSRRLGESFIVLDLQCLRAALPAVPAAREQLPCSIYSLADLSGARQAPSVMCRRHFPSRPGARPIGASSTGCPNSTPGPTQACERVHRRARRFGVALAACGPDGEQRDERPDLGPGKRDLRPVVPHSLTTQSDVRTSTVDGANSRTAPPSHQSSRTNPSTPAEPTRPTDHRSAPASATVRC